MRVGSQPPGRGGRRLPRGGCPEPGKQCAELQWALAPSQVLLPPPHPSQTWLGLFSASASGLSGQKYKYSMRNHWKPLYCLQFYYVSESHLKYNFIYTNKTKLSYQSGKYNLAP